MMKATAGKVIFATMTDPGVVKTNAIAVSAILVASVVDLNPYFQTAILVGTGVYTTLRAYKAVREFIKDRRDRKEKAEKQKKKQCRKSKPSRRRRSRRSRRSRSQPYRVVGR